jgi:hypothetical protein
LVLEAPHRPFVGLGVDPVVAAAEPFKCADVLNDPVFLVVGFFNQETVVLNAGWPCRCIDTVNLLRERETCRQDESEKENETRAHGIFLNENEFQFHLRRYVSPSGQNVT